MRRFVVALALAGFVDSMSNMVVTPSLVFYVTSMGGTIEQYGIIMSAFAFASFFAKPILGERAETDVVPRGIVDYSCALTAPLCFGLFAYYGLHSLGWWSDFGGFRLPYISSLTIAAIGGFVYFLASALPAGRSAVGVILASRLLGGVGAGNIALGYAYVARVVPREEQTSINVLLSMMRTLGLAAGPGLCALIAWVDIPIGRSWTLDPLNSVGLILIISNLIAILSITRLLKEPDEVEAGTDDADGKDIEGGGKKVKDTATKPVSTSRMEHVSSFFSVDILVPMFSNFSFNANIQLIMTGIAPAASDALGWGPVETSVALGSNSVIIFFVMNLVIQLSSRYKVSDPKLLSGGLVAAIVAFLALYFGWRRDANLLQFYLPVLMAVASFPFIPAPTRSLYTAAVNSKPALKKNQGSMQAILSMAQSVSGFIAPALVAAYCLRHPDEVESSLHKRELTLWSLYAPVLSALTLLGVGYMHFFGNAAGDAKEQGDDSLDISLQTESGSSEADEEILITETSYLLQEKPNTKRTSTCNVGDIIPRKDAGTLQVAQNGPSPSDPAAA